MNSNLEIQELLEGNFKQDHQPLSRTIRLYISSEFADTTHERACVIRDVFPVLRSHCNSLGLQFLGVDLYSVLPSSLCTPPEEGPGTRLHAPPTPGKSPLDVEEPNRELDTTLKSGLIYLLEREGMFALAREEIKCSQDLSAGPNFITLLAQRYGFKPLQSQIPQSDFDLLYAAIEESSARNLLHQWYLLDSNVQPPQYILQYPPKHVELREWMSIHDSLSKIVRKAAKVALGKDVSKVQHYVMSAVEEEITHGIFKLKRNPNQCCFWFKRVFTDLLDQRTSDAALETYSDMIPGRRGVEFDPESTKVLNHLKEARLPAKYIGLDSTNIFEFLLKWQKGTGLDPVDNPSHMEYLEELSSEMTVALKEKISATAEALDDSSQDSTCQEVMQHSAYCKKKAITFMDRSNIMEKLLGYISSSSCVPLVLYGENGCGKTHIMAATAYRMREKFPMQKMILITRFIGISPQSFSIRNTLRSICEQLSIALGEESGLVPGDFSSITACFKSLLSEATSERPIYILLDGVDQLSPENGASGMSWLPIQLPAHVKLILSTSSDIKYRCYPVLQSLLAKQPDNLIEVPLLSREECQALLEHQLLLKGRTLTGDQEKAVMMVLQCCPLPVYMDLVLVEVQQWRSYVGSKPWERKAPPITLKDMTEKIFLDMEAQFGKLFFGFLAGYITAAKYGLTEVELLDILSSNQQVMETINKDWKVRSLASVEDAGETSPVLSIPPMLWSQVYQKLLPITELNVGAGRYHVIRWSHRYFSEFATSRYLSSEEQTSSIYGHLADYFSGKCVLPHTKTTEEHATPQPLLLNMEKGLYNSRKLSELPHCLANSGRRQELQDLLTDYDWIKGKISTASCADLVEDFATVLPVVPIQRSEEDSASLYELRLLRDALSLSTRALNIDPIQLPAQLCGRLMPILLKSETKRPVLERLVLSALSDSRSLLTPLQPLQHLPGGPLLVTMTGHRDAVSGLAATCLAGDKTGQSGLCLVSSSWDKTLKSWDLTSTGVLKTFDGHTDKVLCVALTRDGQYAASGAADMTIRLWYTPTAECVHVMTDHTAAVNAVAMTTDGAKTISGSADGTVKVWSTDINTSSCGDIIFTMKNHRSSVLSMTLSNDRFLASGAKNGVTLLTDIVSGGVLHTYRGHEGAVTAVSMTQLESKRYVLSGAEGGSVSVWLANSGQLVHSLKARGEGNSNSVNSISVSANGKAITAYKSGCLSVWDLQSGTHLYDLTGQQHSAVLSLVLADGDSLLFTGSQDSSLQTWDMLSSPVLQDKQHVTTAGSISISPCGMYGVSGGGDNKIKLYDLKKSSIVGEIETDCEGITQVLVLRDSQRVLVAFQNGAIQLWNGVTRELLVTFQDHGSASVSCVAVSPDSSLLMCGDEDAAVTFWSVKSGAKLKTFHNHTTALVGVAFSGDHMISASRDGLVCVRDYHTAKVLLASTTHTDELLCLATSPNTAFFVTSSRNKTCHVVDMATGKLKWTFNGHRGAVTCAKVLSNCTQCLTGSEDGCLRIWEVEGGESVAMLCVDAPVVSCDISWKGDDILYGTRGGWVSSAVCGDKDRARELMLGCKSSSDLSCTTECESMSSTVETASQEEVDGNTDAKINDSASTGNESEAEKVNVDADLTEKSHPSMEEEIIIPDESASESSSSQSLKKVPHLNGFIADMPSEVPPQEILPAKKERVEVMETSSEDKTELDAKPTSSACLIL